MGAPQENLTREVAFTTFTTTRDAGGGDGLTLEGYGSVSNSDTVIDSWEGNFVERFAPGAWKRTIKNQKPVMQFDHGRDSRVGSTPIGAFELLQEDDNGLFVRARLHDNEQVKPVRDAIASGAISGMSVRFSVVKESWQDPADAASLPVRTITEARLYEVGPVVFPAYADTAVGVRSQVLALATDPTFRAQLLDALTQSSEPVTTPEPGSGDTSERETTSTDDEPVIDSNTDSDDTSERDEEPITETSEPSEVSAPYMPAVRAAMPDEVRKRSLDEVRELVAAAVASEKDPAPWN